MNVGKYDEIVTIQTRSAVANTAGGRAVTWATYARTFANIREATGSEVFKGQQTQNPVSNVVTIPDTDSDKAYTPRMRVLRADGVSYLEVKNIRRNERLDKELIFDCERVRA